MYTVSWTKNDLKNWYGLTIDGQKRYCKWLSFFVSVHILYQDEFIQPVTSLNRKADQQPQCLQTDHEGTCLIKSL